MHVLVTPTLKSNTVREIKHLISVTCSFQITDVSHV